MQSSKNSLLKILLIINNLTIAQFASALNVTPSYISLINTGSREINFHLLNNISEVFNYNIYDLLRVKEYMEKEDDFKRILFFALNILHPEVKENYNNEQKLIKKRRK